jgi:hypothetical protein
MNCISGNFLLSHHVLSAATVDLEQAGIQLRQVKKNKKYIQLMALDPL